MTEQNSEQLREILLSREDVKETISTRAYDIYLNRGAEPGRDLEDWLQAENEVLASLTEGSVAAATPDIQVTAELPGTATQESAASQAASRRLRARS
jgi:hypothetical protein